jgi:hypothetical protein
MPTPLVFRPAAVVLQQGTMVSSPHEQPRHAEVSCEETVSVLPPTSVSQSAAVVVRQRTTAVVSPLTCAQFQNAAVPRRTTEAPS